MKFVICGSPGRAQDFARPLQAECHTVVPWTHHLPSDGQKGVFVFAFRSDEQGMLQSYLALCVNWCGIAKMPIILCTPGFSIVPRNVPVIRYQDGTRFGELVELALAVDELWLHLQPKTYGADAVLRLYRGLCQLHEV